MKQDTVFTIEPKVALELTSVLLKNDIKIYIARKI